MCYVYSKGNREAGESRSSMIVKKNCDIRKKVKTRMRRNQGGEKFNI